MPDTPQFEDALKERFLRLPKVVQDAIISVDVQKHMRDLAGAQKLHIDQWEKLENEVMLTLLGVQQVEDLHSRIEHEVGVPADLARALAENVSTYVFEPIRVELERSLGAEGPSDKSPEELAVEGRTVPSITPTPASSPPAAPMPATPPPPKPEAVVPVPEAPPAGYKPGEPSTARKDVVNDPYREPIS